jgi:hypothetical protein
LRTGCAPTKTTLFVAHTAYQNQRCRIMGETLYSTTTSLIVEVRTMML